MVTDMTQGTQASDEVRRFIIEHHPVRGHWVRLESAWTQLRAHQELPLAAIGRCSAGVTLRLLRKMLSGSYFSFKARRRSKLLP